MIQKEFHSINEVAKRLSCSPRTIRNLILSGVLKAIKIGTGPRAPYRIHESHIEDFIKEQTTHKTPPEQLLLEPDHGRVLKWMRPDFS
jgi:excisionase family DNA binding protein